MSLFGHSGFIGQDRELLRLAARIGELNHLLDAVRRHVPPEVASSCVSVAWGPGETLLIGVRSSAAAARVRVVAPQLRDALSAAGWQASAIRPRVQVALQQEKSRINKDLRLSDSACSAFEQLADTLEAGPLRDAVATLVAHQQQRKAR
ncbi:DciA family protein [Jeongeupia wiesaeckerbachi]|uniref:DciA family protein n=1 Tax=Jeongeupia wiesaeckerbachi TaxID=3051218 RepID=UPI003D807240